MGYRAIDLRMRGKDGRYHNPMKNQIWSRGAQGFLKRYSNHSNRVLVRDKLARGEYDRVFVSPKQQHRTLKLDLGW